MSIEVKLILWYILYVEETTSTVKCSTLYMLHFYTTVNSSTFASSSYLLLFVHLSCSVSKSSSTWRTVRFRSLFPKKSSSARYVHGHASRRSFPRSRSPSSSSRPGPRFSLSSSFSFPASLFSYCRLSPTSADPTSISIFVAAFLIERPRDAVA